MSHAIVIHETGDASSLRWEPHDPGEPGPGQVRVALRAAGVNFIDVYFRSGLYPRPLPFVAGLEGAGVVEAMGPSVEGLAVGDRVAWAAAPGSYAEAVNAHAGSLVKIPEAVSFEVAAAVMLQGMTAHYLMNGCRTTAEGDVALVHAAAGGVGLVLIQLLKQAGAIVIGTCGAAEKVELARKAGADHVIRYDELDFQAEVVAFTDGRGCDVVYDSVGQATFDGSLGCVRPRGLLALFGQSSGPVPPFDLQRLNAGGSQFVTRPSLAHYTASREELEMRSGAILGAVAAGRLDVRIGARFALSEAADAHRALEGRGTTGKVILLPG
ncbi:MAG: quinone oxidoreductase [Deltaproteobacteria bacterium]|nr:quinone oxidoreductase [Deltaproteobacteria bacterium]